MKKIVLAIIALLWANIAFAQTLTTPWTSTPPIGPGGFSFLGPSGQAASNAGSTCTAAGNAASVISGSNTIWTFNSTGAFTCSSSFSAQLLEVGGGGGGGGNGGGGGGAGGACSTASANCGLGSSITVALGTTTVTVGLGGAGGPSSGATNGINGANSQFGSLGSSAALGGGGGAKVNTTPGNAGGSGGGGAPNSSGTTTGGAGTAGQGNNGGGNGGFIVSPFAGGGGGGAGALGGTATANTVAGNGGNGVANTITGASVLYAGGGGSAYFTTGIGAPTTGGTGGGGSGGGGTTGGTAGSPGISNTGGGGGGSSSGVAGASGGSGVVIISCATSACASTASPPTPYLGLVANHYSLPGSLVTGTLSLMNRTQHYAVVAISNPKVLYQNANNNAATSFSVKFSIEYPVGTETQGAFSGVATGTTTAATILSDTVSGLSIPAGASFFVRTYYNSASGIATASNAIPANGEGSIGNASLNGAPDLTAGGTVTTSAFVYYPLAIVATTIQPSFEFLGDSRVAGANDQAITTANTPVGEFAHAITASGYAYANYGISGSTASGFLASNFPLIAVGQYVTHVLSDYGNNDLENNVTAAALLTSQQNIRALFPANQFYVSTIGPTTNSTFSITSLTSVAALVTATAPGAQFLSNGMSITISGATPAAYNGTFTISNVVVAGSSSTFQYTAGSSPGTPATGTLAGTDSWATLGNQATVGSGYNTNRISYNNTIRTAPAWMTGFMENADVVESSRDSGLIKVTGSAFGYTLDGLHWNPFSYNLFTTQGTGAVSFHYP